MTNSRVALYAESSVTARCGDEASDPVDLE